MLVLTKTDTWLACGILTLSHCIFPLFCQGNVTTFERAISKPMTRSTGYNFAPKDCCKCLTEHKCYKVTSLFCSVCSIPCYRMFASEPRMKKKHRAAFYCRHKLCSVCNYCVICNSFSTITQLSHIWKRGICYQEPVHVDKLGRGAI